MVVFEVTGQISNNLPMVIKKKKLILSMDYCKFSLTLQYELHGQDEKLSQLF